MFKVTINISSTEPIQKEVQVMASSETLNNQCGSRHTADCLKELNTIAKGKKTTDEGGICDSTTGNTQFTPICI